MVNLTKETDREIVEEVNKDIQNKYPSDREKVMLFYYRIVTEPKITTSSYRYHYAKLAIETIANSMDDRDTIKNLNKFHSDKLQFEMENGVEVAHPVKEKGAKRSTTTAANKRVSVGLNAFRK